LPHRLPSSSSASARRQRTHGLRVHIKSRRDVCLLDDNEAVTDEQIGQSEFLLHRTSGLTISGSTRVEGHYGLGQECKGQSNASRARPALATPPTFDVA
jgi:hypothetical protein